MNLCVEGILLHFPEVYPAYLNAHGQRVWRDYSMHVRDNREIVPEGRRVSVSQAVHGNLHRVYSENFLLEFEQFLPTVG